MVPAVYSLIKSEKGEQAMTHKDLNVTFDDVNDAMKENGWDINECTPIEVLLGVGFAHFIFDEIVRQNEELKSTETQKIYETKEWEEKKTC